jgi:hypothetical protein
MVKPVFSSKTVQRAAEGKSTLTENHTSIQLLRSIDTHPARFEAQANYSSRMLEQFLDEKYIWSLEKQLNDLRTENQRYREAVGFLLRRLWAALDPIESLVSLLKEELQSIKNLSFFLTFRVGEVTNVWIQLSRRDVKTEMAVAEMQSKVLRLFSTTKIQFLVVPANTANLKKLAPEKARVITLKQS